MQAKKESEDKHKHPLGRLFTSRTLGKRDASEGG